MLSQHSTLNQTTVAPPSAKNQQLHLAMFLSLFAFGFIAPSIGDAGLLLGGVLLLIVVGRLVFLSLRQEQSTYAFFLFLGLLTGSEIFFRDYVLEKFIGYQAVEYILLGLGALNLPALFRAMLSSRAKSIVWPWLLFCIWATMGLLYSVDPVKGRVFLSLYLAGLVIVLLVLSQSDSSNVEAGLLDGLALGAVLTLGVALNLYLSSPQSFLIASSYRFGHALSSAVQIAIILCVGSLALFLRYRGSDRRAWSALVPLSALFTGAIATFSRGPIIALLSAIVVLVFLGRSKQNRIGSLLLFLLIIGAALRFVAFYNSETFEARFLTIKADKEREAIWQTGITAWKQEPVFGWGTGSWTHVYPSFSWLFRDGPSYVSDAHNMVIQAAVETGLVGASLLVLFLIVLAVAAIRNRSAVTGALLIFVVVIGLVENWKISALYVMLAFACAQLYREPNRERDEPWEAKQRTWIDV